MKFNKGEWVKVKNNSSHKFGQVGYEYNKDKIWLWFYNCGGGSSGEPISKKDISRTNKKIVDFTGDKIAPKYYKYVRGGEK